MSRPRRGIGFITVFAISLSATGINSQNVKARINPASPSGLDYYAQGGVVVDGIAYFTASDGSRRKGVKRNKDFRCVVAFDLKTFKKNQVLQLHSHLR
ncbi:MAG: hypothetical protein QGF00_09025 [Planctomycetota bacterium]|nr:hypothetical protein [Planctomycetota bacterium]